MPDTAPSCTALSELAAEPLLGTAPFARAWILLEQPGPWGRRPLTDSHLDPQLGAWLDRQASAASARVALVRRPGHHADTYDPRSFRVWVAWTRPGNTWLLGGWVTDPAELRKLAWAAVASGDAGAVTASVPHLAPEHEPLLLVCTNGRRDVCCALRGRRLVQDVRDDLLGRVWESSHLGGHRFAPTGVVLPHGTMYGRLTPDLALRVMDGARHGAFVPTGYRGRSTFAAPAQAAEGAVRHHAQVIGLDEIDVAGVHARDGSWDVTVTHRDGQSWNVTVRLADRDVARPTSCGAAPEPVLAHLAEIVSAHPAREQGDR